MAQKFVSPGVFTREVDQSFLAAGVAGIGACLIGRSPKGPAFLPTIVGGFDDFTDRFGVVDGITQMPYAARNYLQNSNTLTVVRVLGSADGGTTTSGYTVGGVTAICDASSSAGVGGGQVLAIIHHSGTISNVSIAGVANDTVDFVLKIGATFAVTASFLTSSANYVGKVLNTNPTLYSTYNHYLYQVFPYTVPAASASWSVTAVSGALTNFLRDYSEGISAWVKTQPIGGTDYNLFRFHTRGHGRATNDEVKVCIRNVKPSLAPNFYPYGTFDVQVRSFYDTDQKPVVLESFVACSMDPLNLAYVGRKIGDMYDQFDTIQRKFTTNGVYPAKSKYVRIEMDTVSNAPPQGIPWGHRGYAAPAFVSGSAVKAIPLQPNQVDRNGNVDPNINWGIMFLSGGIADRMRADPDPGFGPGTPPATGIDAYEVQDADFTLANLTASWNTAGVQVWTYNLAGQPSNEQNLPVYSSASMYVFNLPMQGGFDGWDLRVLDPLYLQNSDTIQTAIGVVSARRAIDCVANPDAFDMNLIAIPGVNNLSTCDYARTMVNNRQDVMYVMDITGANVPDVVGNLQNRQLDDNYTACYYPDLRLQDQTTNKILRVAPSVAVMGAMAYNDRVGQPYYAPAGFNRGGLKAFGIVDVVDRLTFADRNSLYDNKINPIATFPAEGIAVFGQKTLQLAASALDRVNVRRLLIYAKKTVASAAKYLLFEPDNAQTWQRFTNLVNPILLKVQKNQGLDSFKVVMDSSTNTQSLIDQNIMTGKIFLAPTKATEFIDLSFVITNAGVQFGS
jgi:Phage tail sheath protein subtilisin-like domain/Phage tail sheath C-terminal domain